MYEAHFFTFQIKRIAQFRSSSEWTHLKAFVHLSFRRYPCCKHQKTLQNNTITHRLQDRKARKSYNQEAKKKLWTRSKLHTPFPVCKVVVVNLQIKTRKGKTVCKRDVCCTKHPRGHIWLGAIVWEGAAWLVGLWAWQGHERARQVSPCPSQALTPAWCEAATETHADTGPDPVDATAQRPGQPAWCYKLNVICNVVAAYLMYKVVINSVPPFITLSLPTGPVHAGYPNVP